LWRSRFAASCVRVRLSCDAGSPSSLAHVLSRIQRAGPTTQQGRSTSNCLTFAEQMNMAPWRPRRALRQKHIRPRASLLRQHSGGSLAPSMMRVTCLCCPNHLTIINWSLLSSLHVKAILGGHSKKIKKFYKFSQKSEISSHQSNNSNYNNHRIIFSNKLSTSAITKIDYNNPLNMYLNYPPLAL